MRQKKLLLLLLLSVIIVTQYGIVECQESSEGGEVATATEGDSGTVTMSTEATMSSETTGNMEESHEKGAKEEEEEHLEEEEEAHFAIIFPWFVQSLGLAAFYILTRYIVVVPYTAMMFLLGVFMGIGRNQLELIDQLTESIGMWQNINAEVLLLVFLPGLVFRDAFGLNVHLFQVGFGQCLIFAFPMVLAGTVLVALVAFYIFPYNWTFNLCMTFGSILAATDPVAVSALLNEVGAPPRLKTHISGESLLNDGAAIVFFFIFSALFLYELGIEGLGEDINLAQGFALFFRMSLGGACIGIVFGVILVLILYMFKRRLNEEENVLQVAATITTAYTCYYTADAVARTSGVIAVVFCGVFTKAFGASFINDIHLMDNFWVLVEHLLNTLLFALGGVVWGGVISNSGERTFVGRDWGYLFVLYFFLILIRFFLMFAFYPIVSRIGLKSSVKEMIFISYGGLRGAVGISLAIALDNEVISATTDPVFRLKTNEVFGMIGGIAFLTLFVNGMTAGPLLKKLGLAKSSAVRERLIKVYQTNMKEKMLDDFVRLMTYKVFQHVDFGFVKHYIPQFNDLCIVRFKNAVLKNRKHTPPFEYRKPYLDNILPYLIKDCAIEDPDLSWVEQLRECPTTERTPAQDVEEVLKEGNLEQLQSSQAGCSEETKQLRLIFIELLRSRYSHMIESGTLDVRAGSPGFVAFALEQSLDFATDHVQRGEPLEDWDATFVVGQPVVDRAKDKIISSRQSIRGIPIQETERHEESFYKITNDVNRAFAFLRAHREARDFFVTEFCRDREDISIPERIVILESEAQYQKAFRFIESKSRKDVDNAKSHILCTILLLKAVKFIESLSNKGLLKEQEAAEYIEELEELLEHVRCSGGYHPPSTRDEEPEKANEPST